MRNDMPLPREAVTSKSYIWFDEGWSAGAARWKRLCVACGTLGVAVGGIVGYLMGVH